MKPLKVTPDVSIRQAMKRLCQLGEKCLVVVDGEGVLLGTLSDGDLRKAILAGSSIGDAIEGIYQVNPTVLLDGKYQLEEAKAVFTENRFDLIPVVDEKHRVVELLFWETVLGSGEVKEKEILDVPVVIMAGGKGSRMEPFTKILPKALVPINDKPIIEHIIDRFTAVGVRKFIVTVNYKMKILKAFFEELDPEFSVEFVEEKNPLGTAGSLKELDLAGDKPLMVTNCDIMVKTDYRDLYSFHNDSGFDITLVASTKTYAIPYGTCELNDEGYLKQIDEKPEYHFLVNTGLYVLSPRVLDLIPSQKQYHITNLIDDAQNMGMKVGVYPIDEDTWIDVGEWTEYRQAVERL